MVIHLRRAKVLETAAVPQPEHPAALQTLHLQYLANHLERVKVLGAAVSLPQHPAVLHLHLASRQGRLKAVEAPAFSEDFQVAHHLEAAVSLVLQLAAPQDLRYQYLVSQQRRVRALEGAVYSEGFRVARHLKKAKVLEAAASLEERPVAPQLQRSELLQHQPRRARHRLVKAAYLAVNLQAFLLHPLRQHPPKS